MESLLLSSSEVSSPDSYPLLPALPSYGLNRDWSLDPSKRPFIKREGPHLLLLELRRRHSALLFGYNLSDVTIEGPGHSIETAVRRSPEGRSRVVSCGES